MTAPPRRRRDGYLPLEGYAAIGDGWSVALCGEDGSIDWWCAPTLESPPVFDRLLDAAEGGCFQLRPKGRYKVARAYQPGSNVLTTEFVTPTGRARLTEAMPLDAQGQPRPQLVRRIEGLAGGMDFDVSLRLARTSDARLETSPDITFRQGRDGAKRGRFRVTAGQTQSLILSAAEPRGVVDHGAYALAQADEAWRAWSAALAPPGRYTDLIRRQALILKLLCAPTGAVCAAATTSLPEIMGGERNWDFRFIWVRDAAYAAEALIEAGAVADAGQIFDWLITRMAEHGPRVVFDLDGKPAPTDRELDVPGYRYSRPAHVGNLATLQRQHGAFGDLLQAAKRLALTGWSPSPATVAVLVDLVDQAARVWHEPDAGIWELSELRLYANSRISCWQALARAIELCDQGLMPADRRDSWSDTRREIEDWIENQCWSETRQSYVAWPGSDVIDASLALTVRFGFGSPARQEATLAAIDGELGCGLFHHRMSGVQTSEGCFLACSFWVAEAKARLGRTEEARASLDALIMALGGIGPLPEMAEAKTGRWLGNMPQGLTHIAIIQAASAVAS